MTVPKLTAHLGVPVGELVRPAVCELCGEQRARIVATEPFAAIQFSAVRCLNCGFCYTAPRPDHALVQRLRARESRNSLVAAGILSPERATEVDTVYDYTQQARFEDNYRRGLQLLQSALPSGTLLDVGCAGGRFVEMAGQAGYRALGCDLTPAGWDTPRARALDLRLAPPNALPDGLPALDVVTLWNVLEHVEHPLQLMSAIRTALQPGGGMLVEVPNMALRMAICSWTGCHRSQKHRYMLYEHIYHYTPRSLTSVLERSGFRVLRFSTANDDASGLPHNARRSAITRAVFAATGGRINWHYPLFCLARAV